MREDWRQHDEMSAVAFHNAQTRALNRALEIAREDPRECAVFDHLHSYIVCALAYLTGPACGVIAVPVWTAFVLVEPLSGGSPDESAIHPSEAINYGMVVSGTEPRRPCRGRFCRSGGRATARRSLTNPALEKLKWPKTT